MTDFTISTEEMKALRERNDALQRALEFYSAEGNWKRSTKGRHWHNSVAADDKGSRARSVLFGLEDAK